MNNDIPEGAIAKICKAAKEGAEQRATIENKVTGEVREVWIKPGDMPDAIAADQIAPDTFVIATDLAPDDMQKVVAEALAEMLK